jgi:hypothetical protein
VGKGFTAVVVFYVASILFTSLVIAGYATSVRDFSWVSEVENYIKKENWEPDKEYVPLMLAAFFINENGEEQFFELRSGHEFYTYIEGLLKNIDRQVTSISKERLDELFSADRILELVYRFPFQLGLFRPSFGAAYFVLEDKLLTGLEGTIILFETNRRLSVWQITNGLFW